MTDFHDPEFENPPAEALRISDHPSFGGEAGQHRASDYFETKLDSDDSLFHYSSADYADIEQDGIHYGLSLAVDALGQIVAGSKGERFADEYREDLHHAEPEYTAVLRQFVADEYGAQLRDDTDRYDDLEFVVLYEAGGARASTIEYMGERADRETQLVRARADLASGEMLTKFAARLGYARGPWVKVD